MQLVSYTFSWWATRSVRGVFCYVDAVFINTT